MAREIRINRIVDEVFKKEIVDAVEKATLSWKEKVIRATPVVTNNLRGSWDHKIEPFVGTVFTNVEYAEPVAYGTSLPPSWGGQFRTGEGQNTIKGYPELIGKQIATDIQTRFNL